MKRNRMVCAAFLLLLLLLMMMIFGAGTVFAGTSPVRINIDGVDVQCDSPPVIAEGRTLVPARAVFEAMGGAVSWDAPAREVAVEMDDIIVKLKIDSKKAYINGTEQVLDVPARIIKDRTMIPVRFVSEAAGREVSWDDKNRVVTILSPVDGVNEPEQPEDEDIIVSEEDQAILDQYGLSSVAAGARQKLVVIDPGHGGADTGSRGYDNGEAVLNEKDVNLDIALRLQKMLQAAGAKIYMIRTEDITIPLYDRQDTANALGASLYVAIHNNSFTNSTPRGTEVHYHGKYDRPMDGISAMELALNLQQNLVSNLGLYNRGAKVSPELAVLRRTVMPAVIIEGAFISNPDDLNYMKTDDFREKYAMSAAKSIIEVLNGSVVMEACHESFNIQQIALIHN